ncbi:MAG: hypothetical protein AAGA32_07890 [Pseudomonadota bacterium]
MDFALGLLAIGTLLAGLLLALNSIRQIEKRRKNGMPKSTLAVDAPSTRPGLVAAE